MKTALTKIRQILIGIVAILSLSVSSIAACACSHHEPDSQAEQSCHSSSSHPGRTIAKRTGNHFSEICECVQSAMRRSAKSEGFKLKKHPGGWPVGPEIGPAKVYSVTPATVTTSQSHSYSNPFFKSATARGPPVS